MARPRGRGARLLRPSVRHLRPVEALRRRAPPARRPLRPGRAPRRAADRPRHPVLRRRAGDLAAARRAVRPAAVRADWCGNPARCARASWRRSRTASRVSSPPQRHAPRADRDRPPARSRVSRPARLPLAQPGARSSGPTPTRSGSRRARPPGRARGRGRLLGRPAAGRPDPGSARRSAELAEAVGLQVEPSTTPTTSWSWAAARPVSPPRCTAPRRACARCSSSARRPAGRRAPRPASRTTSASRAASRATTSRARAREQALRLGAEIVVTRSIEPITPNDDCHTVTLDGGRVLGARAVILATGVSYRALPAEGIDAFARHRRLLRRRAHRGRRDAGPRRDPRRRRQLGRTGGGVLRRLRAQVTILIRGASLERRCRAT